MNRDPLNGPLEVGLRALTVLSRAFPQSYDIASLAFFDYTLLHSDEFGGPESIHPDVPRHRSEIAIKRELIEHGLQVMIRAKLVALTVEGYGLGYVATENAPGFIDLLESDYLTELKSRADWVVQEFGETTPEQIRALTARLTAQPEGIAPDSPLPEAGEGS